MSCVILAIESSCDNSSLCIMDEEKNILFYKNLNQDDMIEIYGGYVPNIMLDKHICNFYSIIQDLNKFNIQYIDYVAICCGPGIILSLTIGYALAVALAEFYSAKMIYIDHIESHIWSHSICHTKDDSIYRPFISIVMSGGHSIISFVRSIKDIIILAKSVDDAPGEVFDKIAFKLNLSPATGSSIDEIARYGKPIQKLIQIKKSKKRNIKDFYNMSFSGIKTRFKNFLDNNQFSVSDIAYSLECTIYNEIYYALTFVLNKEKPCYLAFAGGVLANTYIRKRLSQDFKDYELYFVDTKYAQDNAVMIANMAHILLDHNMITSACCYSTEPYDTFIFNK